MMRIGAPVYWVTKGNVDYTNETIQKLICGGPGCNKYSTNTQLYTASQQTSL